jgi:hypothetical protein
VAESEEQSISRLVDSLTAAFPHLPEAQVRACVQDALAHFANAKIRTYIPVLVARRARAALRCPCPAEEATAGPEATASPFIGSGSRNRVGTPVAN